MRSRKNNLLGSNAPAQIGTARLSLPDIDVASRFFTQTGQPRAQQRVPVQNFSPWASVEGCEQLSCRRMKPKLLGRLARHLTLLALVSPMPTRTRSGCDRARGICVFFFVVVRLLLCNSGIISLVCVACLPLFFWLMTRKVRTLVVALVCFALAFSDCFTAREAFVALHAPRGV